MKHLFIFLLSIVTMFSTFDAVAQKKKKKKKKEEEEVMEIIIDNTEVEEVIYVEEIEEPISGSNRVLSQGYYNFKQKYETSKINDKYDWFYDKNSSYNDRKYGIVNTNGDVILPNLFNHNGGDDYNKIIYLDNKYGLYSLEEKKWTIPIDKDYIQILNSNFYSIRKNGTYTIVDINNKKISDKKWNSTGMISSLKNYVKVSEKRNGNTYYGIFSLLERKLIIPCNYTVFDNLYYNNNLFKVKDATKKYNLININNKLLFNNWYDNIETSGSISNRFIVKNGNNYGVIDSNEKTIIPIEYLSISSSSYSDGSHLSRNKEGKYGFMTIEGQVTLPFEYDNIDKKYGSDNMISVKNNKCGIVRINSGVPQEIISCDYDDIKNFKKLLIIKKDGKYGLLDSNGKIIVQPTYDSLEVLNPDTYNESRIIKGKLKGKYSILNEQGQPITDEKFKDIDIIIDDSKTTTYSYSKYFTFFKVKKKDQFLIMDKIGKVIGNNTFDDIHSEFKNIFVVEKDNTYGLFSLLENKMLIDYSYDLITKTKNNYLAIKGNKVDLLTYQRGRVIVNNK